MRSRRISEYAKALAAAVAFGCVALGAALNLDHRVIVDGGDAAGWKVCVERIAESGMPPQIPECFENGDAIVIPLDAAGLIIYAKTPPAPRVELKDAVRALRVMAGTDNERATHD